MARSGPIGRSKPILIHPEDLTRNGRTLKPHLGIKRADKYKAVSPRVWVWDYLFVLRPTLIFPLWTMLLAGYRLCSFREHQSAWVWGVQIVSLTALFGLVYLLNQIKDRLTDLINGKLPLISQQLVPLSHLKKESVVLSVLMIGGLFAVRRFELLGASVGAFLLAGLVYNLKPLSLQERPWGGMLTSAGGGALLMGMGAFLAHSSFSWLKAIPYLLAFTAGALVTTIPDIAGDRAAGKMTFSVRYGSMRTLRLAELMVIIGLGLSILFQDWVILIPLLVASAGWGWALKRGDEALAVEVNKWAILLLALGVGVYYPVFIIVIIIFYPLARWYYSQRLGMDYPRLSV